MNELELELSTWLHLKNIQLETQVAKVCYAFLQF